MQYLIDSYHLIKDYIVSTPVISSDEINSELDSQLFFKCENFQKSGSFKYRGAIHALLMLDEASRSKGVVTVSSGNHGAALAKAGNVLGINVTVIAPKDINSVKLENIKRYAPKIIFSAPGMHGRMEALELFLSTHKCVFIPPYDHLDIIVGQASVAYELVQEVADLDYLLVPIGGGGLASGSIFAVKSFSPSTKIVGAEPANADDAFQSLLAGELIPQDNPDTVCDGLRASLGALTFPIIQDGIEEIVLVSEQEVISSMKYLHQRLKLLIEPSSATVFAALSKRRQMFQGKKVGLILSGGNIELEKFYGDS